MTDTRPTRTATRRIPAILVAGLLVVGAVMTVFLGIPLTSSQSASSSASVAARIPVLGAETPRELRETASSVPGGTVVPRPERTGALGEADGVVPEGTTTFDGDVAGVANLDPDLLAALRRAAVAASGDGVEIFVTSGWRSPAYQERLLRDAISKYGSRKAAARWVATPETSTHVSGHAVDIGLADAAAWLSTHGAVYGLCQIYRNERWHYELRPAATDDGCPPMYADPTRDPRMQR